MRVSFHFPDFSVRRMETDEFPYHIGDQVTLSGCEVPFRIRRIDHNIEVCNDKGTKVHHVETKVILESLAP